MKRSLFFLIIWGVSLCFYAQSDEYVKEGNSAFSSGKYTEAVKKYKAALVLMANNKVNKGSEQYITIEKKIYQAEENQKLYNSAEAKFRAGTEQGYKSAKNILQQLLKKNKTDANAQRRIKDCDAKLASIEGLKLDKELWDSIHVVKTREAYEYYLAKYPHGNFEKEARQEIEWMNEDTLWKEVLAQNTLEIYKEYLSSSKYQKYKEEANLAICHKNDDLRWKSLSESGDIEAIRDYATKFSASDCKQYINEALIILKQDQYKQYYQNCENYYKQKQYGKAAALYEEIKRHVPLTQSAQTIYIDCKAEISYVTVKRSKHSGDWVNFITQYPDSRHYPEIADKLALEYANQLNAYSTDEDYNKIISLAHDSKVVKTVNEKIEKNRKKNQKKK